MVYVEVAVAALSEDHSYRTLSPTRAVTEPVLPLTLRVAVGSAGHWMVRTRVSSAVVPAVFFDLYLIVNVQPA